MIACLESVRRSIRRTYLANWSAGVARGQYDLLLGTGASLGATNRAGALLATSDLKNLLLDLGVPAHAPSSDGISLALAYEAACMSAGEGAVLDFLRTRFAQCTPLPWHRLIPLMPWGTIWTFNLDDVIERAYLSSPNRIQRTDVRLWQDELVQRGGDTDVVPLIHLHGYVGDDPKRSDPQLVFSLEQYMTARLNAVYANWHTRFRSEFPTEPLIVIGSRLVEEEDFIEVIRAGNSAHAFGYPSVIVAPEFQPFYLQFYLRWGFLPIQATGEEFLQALHQRVNLHLDTLPVNAFASRFTERVFVPLAPEADAEIPTSGHDYYGGHDPYWSDIVNDLDAVPDWLYGVAEDIGAPDFAETRQLIYLLRGPAFSGKSTALLRLAKELQKRGWQPIYFTGQDGLDVSETLAYFRDRPNAILVLESLHFDAVGIAILMDRAKTNSQRMLVLATDRVSDTSRLRLVVPSRFIVGLETRVFIDPTDRLWSQIVQKRKSVARLGILERASPRQQSLHFTQHQRNLYSALGALEDATGFVDRGLEVFQQLPSNLCRSFTAIALIGYFGLPTPAGAAAGIGRMSVDALVRDSREGGGLFEWVEMDRSESGLMRLRHRYLGNLVVRDPARTLCDTSLLELAKLVCVALAPSVDVQAIIRRKLEYRIVAELMRADHLRRWGSESEINVWYGEIETLYSWNARYWEQRALALTDRLDAAFSYAQKAVGLHSDALTLTTLGTVLMRRSVATARQSGSDEWIDFWKLACEALNQAAEAGEGRIGYPYMTFLMYTRQLLRGVGRSNDAWQEVAEREFRTWYRVAGGASLLSDRASASLLGSFPGDWLRSAGVPDNRKGGRK